MAPSTRFERVTYRLGGDCSIQLSYEGVGRIIATGLYRFLRKVLEFYPRFIGKDR